ncbi:MAG: hypothetical protein AB1714_27975 [Acidobacteriota bacterium]
MMKHKIALFVFFALAAALPGVGALSAEEAQCAELKAEVPVLEEFHEVIFPLWHNAWPNKDYALIKELLPQVREYVAKVEKVELPGILRDKKAKWQEGVTALAASAAALDKAVAEGNNQAMLDGVETLHARYEGLVRTVWPVMDELDAYHVVLYQIYHYYLPEKQADKLRAASVDLAKACDTLVAAQVPKRHVAKEAALKEGFAALCEATRELQKAAAGSDFAVTEKAVEKVHTQYQKVETLF